MITCRVDVSLCMQCWFLFALKFVRCQLR
uniref:Uncharacterized protein n=1 Tax=Arundo donax TaxID=35708 RepID=A0A0A8ZVX0_ARUDO